MAGLDERISALDEERKRGGGSQHFEDFAMKAAMHVFGKVLLSHLGIEGELQELIPTESVILDMQVTYGDFNYLDEEGVIAHLEFQSSNAGVNGLKQNRLRDAAMSIEYGVDVVTYVIYSGNVKNPVTELPGKLNPYRVHAIILKDDNADDVFRELQEKLKESGKLERNEIVQLLLTPLMGGEMKQYERIEGSFQMLEQSKESFEDAYELSQFQAVMYALASKFLTKEELEKLKGGIKMTYLGELIWKDAIKEGIEIAALKMLEGGVNRKIIAQNLELSEEKLEKLLETKM